MALIKVRFRDHLFDRITPETPLVLWLKFARHSAFWLPAC
jgi:hypothetical protein